MLKLKAIHDIVIICKDYQASRLFYTGILGLPFAAEDLDQSVLPRGVPTESIRTDPFTGNRFTFSFDPDRLPLNYMKINNP